jgi:hypothetical protein
VVVNVRQLNASVVEGYMLKVGPTLTVFTFEGQSYELFGREVWLSPVIKATWEARAVEWLEMWTSSGHSDGFRKPNYDRQSRAVETSGIGHQLTKTGLKQQLISRSDNFSPRMSCIM